MLEDKHVKEEYIDQKGKGTLDVSFSRLSDIVVIIKLL